MTAKAERIPALTGARFPAIMVIVFSHFEFLLNYGDFGVAYWQFWHNPTMGVDFFFMASGFGMMLGSMREDPKGIAPIGGVRDAFAFGWRHVKSIYPLYVVTLLASIPFWILDGVGGGNSTVAEELLRCLLLLLMDLTLLQSMTGHIVFAHSLNSVCWFLSSLFCIYLVSPRIMRSIKRCPATPRAMVIGVAACIVFSATLGALFGYIEDVGPLFDDLSYGSPYHRVFYVMAGMFLARLYSCRRESDTGADASSLVGSGAFEHAFVVASVIWFFTRTSSGLADTLLAYVIDMLLVAGYLYALALGRGVISRLLRSKPMVYLGTISVYVFLTHHVIRRYLNLGINALGIKCLVVGIAEAVLMLAISLLVSVKLCNRKRRRRASRQAS